MDDVQNENVILWNPSKKKEVRNALEREQVADILANLHRLADERDILLLTMLIYTGMRRDEVLGLKWENIDFKHSLIHVVRGVTFKCHLPHIDTPKTDAAIRSVPMPAALQQYLHPKDDNLFVIGGGEQPITEQTMKRVWERIKKTINVYGAMPHVFRHNFATLLFEAGVEPLIAMKILGHTDYQTTANIYTHLNSEMMKKSSVDMEDVFRRKQEAKGVLAEAKSAKEKRSRKPAVDAACRGPEDSNGYKIGHDAQRAMANFVLLTDIELDISARKGSFL